MLKKILHPNFKKIYTIQYIINYIYSTILIGITLLLTLLLILMLTNIINISEMKGELGGMLAIFSIASPAFWFTFLPLGIGVYFASHIAYKLNKENKWKLAKCFSLIIVYKTATLCPVLWVLVVFSIYAILFSRPENSSIKE